MYEIYAEDLKDPLVLRQNYWTLKFKAQTFFIPPQKKI